MVRTDILSPPQQAVQAIHASVEMARAGLIPQDLDSPHLVLCATRDDTELHETAELLSAAGVEFRTFNEPDIGGHLTALCTMPVDRNRLPARLRKHLRRLDLLGQQECIR